MAPHTETYTTKPSTEESISHSSSTGAGTAAAPARIVDDPVPEVEVPTATAAEESENYLDETEIAGLAYELWIQRGCPHGSPEVDWNEARQQLLAGRL